MNLYQKNQYKAPYLYMMNHCIKEYDIEKANISILRNLNKIDNTLYDQLYNMDKKDRQVYMGNLMRNDKDLILALQQGIIDARYKFLTINNILPENILYIDNDSITILEPMDSKSYLKDFIEINSYVHFRLKNVYSIMYRLGKIDFLYISDSMTGKEVFRIKYANQEEMYNKHKNGFLDFLLTLSNETEKEMHQGRGLDTLSMLKHTYDRYTSYELTTDFYREFNQKSQYRLKPGGAFVYFTEFLPNISIDNLDISYNATLLRDLSKYLYNEYFKTKNLKERKW